MWEDHSLKRVDRAGGMALGLSHDRVWKFKVFSQWKLMTYA